MVVSVVFGTLWLYKKILPERPGIAFVGSGLLAALMLSAGIMEMFNVDKFIDINEISDDEILHSPLFIHNFIMCIFSIFCTFLFLLQFWTLYDYCRWVKEKNMTSAAKVPAPQSDSSSSSSSQDSVGRRNRPSDEIKPIPPTLEQLSPVASADYTSIDKETPVLYCCIIDLYEHLSKRKNLPIHEFHVIHVL
ncbi:uncharacterized protein [Prorops nasuta]|uniref:uncharacterized protein isoform X2 n=1 Tax=Prorops nasuta TaxID=863751 RepID=UPI0034CF050E